MKVLKFGGSSVTDADAIRRVVAIIEDAQSRDSVTVVVSALGGVTDHLIEAVDSAVSGAEWRSVLASIEERHRGTLVELAPSDRVAHDQVDRRLSELKRLLSGVELVGECAAATRDRVLAAGERLSAPTVAAALRAAGIEAEAVDGTEVLATDSDYGHAEVSLVESRDRARLRIGIEPGDPIPVVTGFIGSDREGRTTTIGRGGSDFSATVLAAVLGADGVEIWTDVNGVLTAPPKCVSGARTQPELSFDEAAELARFGASVLFEKTIAPVRDLEIPITVKNTFHTDGRGTTVSADVNGSGVARALAAVEDVTVFTVDLGRADGFQAMAALGRIAASCLMMFQASATGRWALVVPGDQTNLTERRLSEAGGSIVDRRDRASIVAVVGAHLLSQPWIVGRCLETLGRHKVTVRGTVSGPSPHVACLIVDGGELNQTLGVLHEALMLDRVVEPMRKGGRDGRTKSTGGYPRRNRRGRTAAGQPAA